MQAQFGFAGDSQTETRLAQYDEASGAWVAAIPDTYMTQSRDVHVYVYVSYGQTEEASRAKTCYEAVFRPISRPAPGDAVSPDQVSAWDALVQEINLTLATVNTAISGQTPQRKGRMNRAGRPGRRHRRLRLRRKPQGLRAKRWRRRGRTRQ